MSAKFIKSLAKGILPIATEFGWNSAGYAWYPEMKNGFLELSMKVKPTECDAVLKANPGLSSDFGDHHTFIVQILVTRKANRYGISFYDSVRIGLWLAQAGMLVSFGCYEECAKIKDSHSAEEILAAVRETLTKLTKEIMIKELYKSGYNRHGRC